MPIEGPKIDIIDESPDAAELIDTLERQLATVKMIFPLSFGHSVEYPNPDLLMTTFNQEVRDESGQIDEVKLELFRDISESIRRIANYFFEKLEKSRDQKAVYAFDRIIRMFGIDNDNARSIRKVLDTEVRQVHIPTFREKFASVHKRMQYLSLCGLGETLRVVNDRAKLLKIKLGREAGQAMEVNDEQALIIGEVIVAAEENNMNVRYAIAGYIYASHLFLLSVEDIIERLYIAEILERPLTEEQIKAKEGAERAAEQERQRIIQVGDSAGLAHHFNDEQALKVGKVIERAGVTDTDVQRAIADFIKERDLFKASTGILLGILRREEIIKRNKSKDESRTDADKAPDQDEEADKEADPVKSIHSRGIATLVSPPKKKEKTGNKTVIKAIVIATAAAAILVISFVGLSRGKGDIEMKVDTDDAAKVSKPSKEKSKNPKELKVAAKVEPPLPESGPTDTEPPSPTTPDPETASADGASPAPGQDPDKPSTPESNPDAKAETADNPKKPENPEALTVEMTAANCDEECETSLAPKMPAPDNRPITFLRDKITQKGHAVILVGEETYVVDLTTYSALDVRNGVYSGVVKVLRHLPQKHGEIVLKEPVQPE